MKVKPRLRTMKVLKTLAWCTIIVLLAGGLAYRHGFQTLAMPLALVGIRLNKAHMIRTAAFYALVVGTGTAADYVLEGGGVYALDRMVEIEELLFLGATACFLVVLRMFMERAVYQMKMTNALTNEARPRSGQRRI